MGTQQTMGSHKPVLMAILDIFQPKSAMEFGMGLNSTRLLWERVPFFVTVENDQKWYTRIVNELPIRKGAVPIYHNLGPNIHAKIKPNQFPSNIRADCKKFYKEIGNKYGKMDMLFVDQFAVLRTLSLNCLYHFFNIIIFHDSEHPGYHYEEFTSQNLSNYHHYRFASMKTHTDILIAKAIMADPTTWNNALMKYGKEYCDQFGQSYKHQLIHLKG